MLIFRQILVHIQIEGGCNRHRFAHIIELDIFLAEQFFEDIRNSKLLTSSIPMSCFLFLFSRNIPICVLSPFNTSILSDIYGIIHQAHLLIGCLMLKRISMTLAIIHDKLDDLRSRVRNLDTIRLDVSHRETPLLNLMF